MTDEEEDDDYIESFFDGILGDDDGKLKQMHVSRHKTHLLHFNLDDDDDDDDEPQSVSQPAQQASQQISSSPITADEPVVAAVDESVADNIDDISANNEVQADATDSDAKDPQQAAQDQAATVNNNIDPVGNEAIVDDEDGNSTLTYYY